MAERVIEGFRMKALMDAVDAFRVERRCTQGRVIEITGLHPNTVCRYVEMFHGRGWIRPCSVERTGRRGMQPLVWEWVG